MDFSWRYRGRDFTRQDIDFVRTFVAARPDLSRRGLSLALCEVWQWKQANGAPRDMVCRGLLLSLHRAGHITLPAARPCSPHQNRANRNRPEPLVPDNRPVIGALPELGDLRIEQVRRTGQDPLFNSLTISAMNSRWASTSSI